MTAITEFLYPAPAKRTVGGIMKWWEKRRLAYNVAVGTAGLFTVGYGSLVMMLWGEFEPVPLVGVAVFGVMANLCYLFGPAVEILVEKIWGNQVLPVGPALYRMGLTFSVGLALFPALIITMISVVRVVIGLF